MDGFRTTTPTTRESTIWPFACVSAHNEQHPLTYLLFPCDLEDTREIAHHALPLPNMTFDAFKAPSVTEQRSIRVLYSNHVETLRLATSYSENTQESK
jgi:hypothetical protein